MLILTAFASSCTKRLTDASYLLQKLDIKRVSR